MFLEGMVPVWFQSQERQFICPGETHPITRAVHLSRLASYFAACRECPFRTEAGSLAPHSLQDDGPLRIANGNAHRRPSIFHRDGVRGVWRNEITRRLASDIASHFAVHLWKCPTRQTDASGAGSSPLVVIGHDERISSPDIITGVAEALRLMGCQVIDLSLATSQQLAFGLRHLSADGGVFVTGAGFGPSFTGLDFLLRGGIPLSLNEQLPAMVPSNFLTLDDLEAALARTCERPAREAPPQISASVHEQYVRSLLKHFHALRPLQVCCTSSSRLVRESLEKIFAGLPCGLHLAASPVRQKANGDPTDADFVRIGEFVCEQRADLGVVIDDDGKSCGVVDERGHPVPHGFLSRVLLKTLLKEHPGGTVVLAASIAASLGQWAEQHGGRVKLAGDSAQSIAQIMRDEEAVFAADSLRIWSRAEDPGSDAIVTLAFLLDALSRSDRPLSEIVRLVAASDD